MNLNKEELNEKMICSCGSIMEVTACDEFVCTNKNCGIHLIRVGNKLYED